jgi:tetratricopeptide (TPR) repeat protein
VDAVALYEALDKRFAAATNAAAPVPGLPVNPPDSDLENGMGDMQKAGAQIYYLLGLISQNRTKDAVVIAKKMNGQNMEYLFDEAFKAMQHAGYTEALDNFFNELLTQDPALPFWGQYVEIAAQAGQTERMLAVVRGALDKPDLSDNKKAALHQILFKALLAADNSEEAVQEMRRIMTLSDSGQSPEGYNAGQLGVLLARIGILLQKPEWTDEGIAVAKKWLATPAGRNYAEGNADEVAVTLAEILSDLKRGPAAETVLTDALTAATAQSGARAGYEWDGSPARHLLTELAALYYKANRPQDVLDLLQNSPDWGAGDISGLFSATPGENTVTLMWLHTGVSPLPVPYLAASALLATGQKEAAEKINGALLDQFPGLDRGYELLLAINGTNAIPKLDELFKHDQFEERPLIWKAHLLREQGRLEAAEKLLRQAINIDPSDGEEGRGDRMRVYAELAEVREARGDKKEADFYREVVKSIRMSEQADQFYSAGLLKRAVAMYEEALKHFSDAYCIQSRLAIQLAALGLTEEAEVHYRRAYELMPDSFGRVESHCFGCEKVFDGERAQSIAEKTFTKLAEERPDKPQIHYLLGYLHQEEEHDNEARTNYLAAVRLDPDYLNVWVKLQEVSRQVLMSPKERDAITFNILRLDPLRRHAQPDFRTVSNLPELWKAVAVAAAQQPVAGTNLLALPASQLALEKKQKDTPDLDDYFRQASQERLSPAQAVGETPFVNLAGEMILNNGRMDE